jgi:hypothetical protein
LNAAFAMAILDLISQVHLPPFVNTLPKYLKHSTFSSCFWSIIIVNGDGCFEIVTGDGCFEIVTGDGYFEIVTGDGHFEIVTGDDYFETVTGDGYCEIVTVCGYF